MGVVGYFINGRILARSTSVYMYACVFCLFLKLIILQSLWGVQTMPRCISELRTNPIFRACSSVMENYDKYIAKEMPNVAKGKSLLVMNVLTITNIVIMNISNIIIFV